MNRQLTLLNEPRARHDNPPTSVVAAESMRPAAGVLEQTIVDTVRAARRPVTAEYIAHEISATTTRWDHGGIVTAVSRAKNNGLLVVAGEGLTSRNRPAQTYTTPGGKK